MGKKKQILAVTNDFSFTLLSVICHHKDYRLCYELNSALNIDLKKQDNLDVRLAKRKENAEFSLYQHFYSEEKNISVVSNKNGIHTLVPEMPGTDYFILLNGGFIKTEVEEIKKTIKQVKIVLGLYDTDPESLKSKENLIL